MSVLSMFGVGPALPTTPGPNRFKPVIPTVPHIHLARRGRRTPAGQTVLQSRMDLHTNRERGMWCPSCDQWYQERTRGLYEQMGRWLIELVAIYEGEGTGAYIPSKRLSSRGGDYAKLIHWGLVERQSRHSTFRPTPEGVAFSKGNLLVPSGIVIRNNNLLVGFTDDWVSIQDVLGTQFQSANLAWTNP